MNEVTGLHQPSDETDDSCRFQFIEIVPLDRDTDETRSAEWDGEDPSVDVTQEYCHDIKQEPKDEYDSDSTLSAIADFWYDGVGIALNRMQPLVLMERMNVARLEKKYNICILTECDNDTQQVDIKVEDIKGEDIRYEVPPAENADSSGSLVVASDITVPPTDCAGPSPPVHQYICGVCQSVFAHRLLLTTHKRRLGHEWSKCDVCGRMLNCALKLAEHVCRRTVRRPTVCHQKFKCGFCRRSFACWVFLMTHLRSHSSGHVQLDHNYSRPTECCKLCTADPCGGKDPERHSRRSGRGTSRREKPEQHDQHQSGAYAGSRDVFPSVGEFKSVWEILSDVEFLPDGEFPSDGEFPLGGEFTPGGECLSDAEFLPDGTLT